MLNLQLNQGGIKGAPLTEIYCLLSTVTNRLLLSLSSVQEDLTPDPGPWTLDPRPQTHCWTKQWKAERNLVQRLGFKTTENFHLPVL